MFEGIGDVIESKLWEQGLRNWTDDQCFTRACEVVPGLQSQKDFREQARAALEKSDVGLLSRALPQHEHWRLWEQFGGNALYLDIETNGLGSWAQITVLGTLYQGKYRGFVHGKDLDEAWEYLNRASLVVSFNGKQFDVPFIERHFSEQLNLPHVDLRWVAGSLGYRGGLKKIEPEFGIERSGAIKLVNGYEAVVLWKRYQRGDTAALRKLIDYNQADVEGLPVIMRGCWERKRDGIRN